MTARVQARTLRLAAAALTFSTWTQAAFAQPAAPSPSPTQPLAAPRPGVRPPPAAQDEDAGVLLELRLDQLVLAQALPSLQFGREVFVPLGELARLLTLPIRSWPAEGRAEGLLPSSQRTFHLDTAASRFTLADAAEGFDPALVRLRPDDIYVATTLLSRWLPLDLQVNLSTLTLRVLPRERLPLQDRLERESAGARNVPRTGDQDPGHPRQELPYRLLGLPFIDQTLSLGVRREPGGRQTSAAYTAYLTGDLLGLETALFASTTRATPGPEVRFTVGRHDPDAGLLGPLRARSVIVGSGALVPSVSHIGSGSPAGSGWGFVLSNRPIDQPLNFDRHTLRGELPPGWDVELFFNDAPVGFQASRPDGLYSFEDQPLVFGVNEFRLVFHGPLGQQRVERRSFLLEQSTTPPGELHYRVAGHRDGTGDARSLAQFEWGVNKSLAVTAGFARLPAPVSEPDPQPRAHTQVGMRYFGGSFIAGTELVTSPGGGRLIESFLKTRIASTAISYNRLQLHDFRSEVFPLTADPLKIGHKLRLDHAVGASGWTPILPVTLELRREQHRSGQTDLAVAGRVTAHVAGLLLSKQANWQRFSGSTTAGGAIHVSRRLGDTGLSAQLGYAVRPLARLQTLAVAADKRLGPDYVLNLSAVRSMETARTSYAASLNKSLGRFGVGLSMTYGNRALALGLQLFVAMGRDPRGGSWRFTALPGADSGAASARVFLDRNANGVMDPGDEAIPNVALSVNGNRTPARTDAAGLAWLDRLPLRQGVDIALDATTLEDPFWLPQRKGVRVVPRPGRVAEIDFAVVQASEIDGTVRLAEKAGPRGIGKVLVELVDRDGGVVAAIQSSADGYYIVPGVLQGTYQVRVSPAQLRELNLADPGPREVTIAPDGKFVNGVDFLLQRNPPLGALPAARPARETSAAPAGGLE